MRKGDKMEKEQIIKGLECCKSANSDLCKVCPYKCKAEGANDIYITCINLLVADTLTLIKELTEENKKLGIDNFDLICELSRIKEKTLKNLQLELSMHFGTYKTDDAIKISDLFKLMDNITDKLIDNNTEDK